MKIKKQLILSSLLFVSLIVIVSTYSLYSINRIASQNVLMYQHPFVVSNTVREINALIISMHRYMKDVVLSRDQQELFDAISKVDEAENLITIKYDIIFKQFLGDSSEIKEKQEQFLNWKPIRDEVIGLVKQGRHIEAGLITKGKGKEYVESLHLSMAELVKFANYKAEQFFEHSQKVKSDTTSILIILIIISALIATIITFIITKNIMRPLNILSNGLSDFFRILKSETKTITKIEYPYQNEFGLMIKSVNHNINNIISLNTDLASKTKALEVANKSLSELLRQQDIMMDEISINEKKFKDIVETSSDWIWEVDKFGVYTYSSPVVEAILGYNNDEIIGKTPFDLMPEEEAKKIAEKFSEIVQSQISFENLENINIHKNGSFVILSTSGIPLCDNDGELIGYRGIDRDITIDKKMAIELEKEKNEAVIANQAKSDFLANMSHEIRTPMHGILAYANMGINKFDKTNDDNKLRFYRNIRDSGNRLLVLLNDLLDLAKLEAGKMELNCVTESLYTLTLSCVAEQQARLDESEISIFYMPDNIEGKGNYDDIRLGQVITNLLSNAIKFSDQNSQIDISILHDKLVGAEKEKKPAILFSIHDNGEGITENNLESIFSKFIQNTGEEQGTRKGTGLGLSICREIIELHHGKIWAENHPDGGAVFSFIIPKNQPELDNK